MSEELCPMPIFGPTESSKSIFVNFIIFCILFSVCHATVDGILAIASTELGPQLGSFSGFVLYILYTFSSLVICKPFLRYFSSKFGVFVGLCGMLCYVSSFLLSILFRPYATPIFLTGAALGGIGAGILWTSESSYYSAISLLYAEESDGIQEVVKNSFSSIFASFFMGLETIFKFLLTVIYMLNRNNRNSTWQVISFTLYTAAAFSSVLVFGYYIIDLDHEEVTKLELSEETGELVKRRKNPFREMFRVRSGTKLSAWDFLGELGSVSRVMLSVPLLQLLIPFQITFGFSAGFVDFYVNRVIVASYLGEGYIGLFTALATLSAAVLSYPFALISNRFSWGKWSIMVLGNLCFLFGGLPILLLRSDQMKNWAFLVFYFVLHGAARGIWESLNKAVVADYFLTENLRHAAFAAIYFTSGLSGAIGFISYQYMTTTQLALLNTIVPLTALICYHWSYRLHRLQQRSGDNQALYLENVYGPLHSTQANSRSYLSSTTDDCWTNELDEETD